MTSQLRLSLGNVVVARLQSPESSVRGLSDGEDYLATRDVAAAFCLAERAAALLSLLLRLVRGGAADISGLRLGGSYEGCSGICKMNWIAMVCWKEDAGRHGRLECKVVARDGLVSKLAVSDGPRFATSGSLQQHLCFF